MKDIKLYITEKLSDENKTLLKYLMSTNKLTNSDVIKLASEKGITKDSLGYNRWFVNKKTFKENYLKSHGLGTNSFKGNYDISDTLLKFFLKDEKNYGRTRTLNKIIKNNGVCSLDSFLDGNDIFGLCGNWSDIAEKIANIDYIHAPNGASIGKYEILIRFILQITEGRQIFGSGGDVIINTGNDEISIEVKGADGRMSGQKVKLNPISNVYKKLFLNIVNDSTEEFDKIYKFIPQAQNVQITYQNYFQNTGKGGKRGDINQSPLSLQNLINAVFDDKVYTEKDTKEQNIKRFLCEESENNKNNNFFIYLADALMKQYRETGIKIDVEYIADQLYKVNNSEFKFIDYEKDSYQILINSENLINCVGAIQLYMYSQSKDGNSEFDYMAVFNKFGKYCIIDAQNDLNSDNFILKVLEKVYFKPIGTDTTRGRGACQINLR